MNPLGKRPNPSLFMTDSVLKDAEIISIKGSKHTNANNVTTKYDTILTNTVLLPILIFVLLPILTIPF